MPLSCCIKSICLHKKHHLWNRFRCYRSNSTSHDQEIYSIFDCKGSYAFSRGLANQKVILSVGVCLDRCHIPIIRPSKSETAYFNCKRFYSINVQGMYTILSVSSYIHNCGGSSKCIWCLTITQISTVRHFLELSPSLHWKNI